MDADLFAVRSLRFLHASNPRAIEKARAVVSRGRTLCEVGDAAQLVQPPQRAVRVEGESRGGLEVEQFGGAGRWPAYGLLIFAAASG